MKFDVRALALAFGLTRAVSVLLLGFLGMYNGYGMELISLLGGLYNGFDTTTVWGIIMGGVWAFADGFIGGLILALLYNTFACGTMVMEGEEIMILEKPMPAKKMMAASSMEKPMTKTTATKKVAMKKPATKKPAAKKPATKTTSKAAKKTTAKKK